MRIKKAGRNGILNVFNEDLLIYETKEFSLNVFYLFNGHGNLGMVLIDEETSGPLTAILNVFQDEYLQYTENLLLLMTLLKAFA